MLAVSHLVNVAGEQRRGDLLAACARHRAADGVVLLQRYPVAWLRGLGTQTGWVGVVEVTLSVADWQGDRFAGEVVYRLGDRQWVQRFDGEAVDDAALDRALEAAGLRRDALLDPDGTWVRARPLS